MHHPTEAPPYGHRVSHRCAFDQPLIGQCKKPPEPGHKVCDFHLGMMCLCGHQATAVCPEEGCDELTCPLCAGAHKLTHGYSVQEI